MTQAAQIERAIKSMRPLPRVAQRVLQIVQDPDYDIDELANLVSTDPSLCARVLRLCNSARSGLASQIATIGDAVSYLGTRNLVQLVLVTCSASIYAVPRRTIYFDPEQLWYHAIACGVTCQVLASQSDLQPATAFTAGVLHDVGILVLDQLAAPDHVRSRLAAAAGKNPCVVEFERECFGIDHAAANRMVADAWQLLPTLGRAIADHHEPVWSGAADDLAGILHIAEHLVAQSPVGGILPGARSAIAPAALERLGLDREQLEALSARATEEVVRLAEVLNLHAISSR